MIDNEMQQVVVTIAERSYRMACGPGEEQHLEKLALMLDERIRELRKSVGEIGEMRLQVMAALTIADELSEANQKVASLEQDLQDVRRQNIAGGEREQFLEAKLCDAISKAAERIETMAIALNSPRD